MRFLGWVKLWFLVSFFKKPQPIAGPQEEAKVVDSEKVVTVKFYF